MTATFSGSVSSSIGWTWRDHVGESPIVDSNQLEFSRDFSDGTGDYQANAIWHAENQVLAPNEAMLLSLDLLAQPLFGDVITVPLAKVKALQIVNLNESGAGCLAVGGADDSPWAEPFGSETDKIRVPPNSSLLMVHAREGWDVPEGATMLKLQAVGGAVNFHIAIIGVLADEPEFSSGG